MTDDAENRQELTSVPPTEAAGSSSGADEPPAGLILDQASLDALLAADALEEAEGESAGLDDSLTDENELDALIQEQTAEIGPQAAAPNADTGQFFDASALRSLLDDDTVLGTEAPDAPLTTDSAETIDASALQALLDDNTVLGADTPPAAPGAASPEMIDVPPADTTLEETGDMLHAPNMEDSLSSVDLETPIINAELTPIVAEVPLPQPEQSLSQDVISSLVAAAHSDEAHPESEPLAQQSPDIPVRPPVPTYERVEPAPPIPAAEPPVGGAQTGGAQTDGAQSGAQSDAQPAQEAPRTRRFGKRIIRWPEPVTAYFERNFLKMLTTLATATVAALGTYTYLYVNPEQLPDAASIDALSTSELNVTIEEAQRLIDEGAYAQAAEKLQRAMAAARNGERAGAQYLLTHALYLDMVSHPTSDKNIAVLDRINAILEANPQDAHAVDLLRWKAHLFSMQGLPLASASLYADLIRRATGHPELDAILTEAANSAMTGGKTADAVRYLERLLREFPGAPSARNAKLLLGRAYASAGRSRDAAAAFEAVAQSGQDAPARAEAAASLAQLALDQGRTDEAIRQLEERVAAATSVQGNDRIYLALARAYRAAGRAADARNTLNDVLNFFPESEVTPAIHLELCKTLEDLAQPDRALQTAREAARRYPSDRPILTYLAALLSRDGQFQEAATYRLAANDAGQPDPELLLAAARDFRAAGEYDKAIRQYHKLLGEFPRFPQALEGNIELCETLFDQGEVTEAVDRLENLATAMPEGPRQLPVLVALSRLYANLGVPERTIAICKKMTSQSSEPAVLARAAIYLMQSGAWDEGIAIAVRTDPAKLDAKTAAALLTKCGEGLLMSNPRQSVEVLEKAYNQYPDHRTPQLEEILLKAWLAAANTHGPDAMVATLEASVTGGNKENVARLVKAATTCGDDAFARGDNARAAEMYGKVLKAQEPAPEAASKAEPKAAPEAEPKAEPKAAPEAAEKTPEATPKAAPRAAPKTTPEANWARYQRANALMRLASFEESAALFDEVAATNAPYAEDAKMKADVARLEKRLGRTPAPPKPAADAGTQQGPDRAAPQAG